MVVIGGYAAATSTGPAASASTRSVVAAAVTTVAAASPALTGNYALDGALRPLLCNLEIRLGSFIDFCFIERVDLW